MLVLAGILAMQLTSVKMHVACEQTALFRADGTIDGRTLTPRQSARIRSLFANAHHFPHAGWLSYVPEGLREVHVEVEVDGDRTIVPLYVPSGRMKRQFRHYETSKWNRLAIALLKAGGYRRSHCTA